jgi:hypothetical protein
MREALGNLAVVQAARGGGSFAGSSLAGDRKEYMQSEAIGSPPAPAAFARATPVRSRHHARHTAGLGCAAVIGDLHVL